jgi:hypothetical protein
MQQEQQRYHKLLQPSLAYAKGYSEHILINRN